MTDPDRKTGREANQPPAALYTETVIETPDEPVRRRFEDLLLGDLRHELLKSRKL